MRVLKSNALYYLLNIPEKSIKGNMASSGMFVIAVQTFSSNNFNTVKEKILERMLFCLTIVSLNENQNKPLPRGLVFPDVRNSQNVFRQSWSHFKL